MDMMKTKETKTNEEVPPIMPSKSEDATAAATSDTVKYNYQLTKDVEKIENNIKDAGRQHHHQNSYQSPTTKAKTSVSENEPPTGNNVVFSSKSSTCNTTTTSESCDETDRVAAMMMNPPPAPPPPETSLEKQEKSQQHEADVKAEDSVEEKDQKNNDSTAVETALAPPPPPPAGGKRMQSSMVTGGGSGGGGGGGSHRGGEHGGHGSGNFAHKQASMSGVNARNSSKGVIRVNLSLNQDVKLNETDNAWRPRVLQKDDDPEDPEAKQEREKQDLLRRVSDILNKLTPENVDALVEEIIKLKINTPDKMEAVMILVFEKAVGEPNFSVSYARLCHRLIVEVKARDGRMEKGTKSTLSSFRNALLDKTEREFTQNVTQSRLKQAKLQPIIEKIKECIDPQEKAELQALLEEEELRIRRRSGGTVRFIGELFKISMLTGKIIYSCVEQLLNPKSEDMLECLCQLLTTAGAKLEQTPISSKEPTRLYSLEKVIQRMQAIASKADKEGEKISSRVRFMLQDVIDLRKNKWQLKLNEALDDRSRDRDHDRDNDRDRSGPRNKGSYSKNSMEREGDNNRDRYWNDRSK